MRTTIPAIALAILVGCGGPSRPTDPNDGIDRTAILQHLSTNVLLPMQTEFVARVTPLPDAIASYCDALDSSLDASPDAARAAWRLAMDSWHRAEALLIGPAAMDNRTLGTQIYAWPLVATCRIDRDTASRFVDPASYDITTRLVNERSLATVEYLLHRTDPAHTCTTTPAGWDSLGANLPRARCRLAEVISRDVVMYATVLETAWRPDGGDYGGELARAGQSGSSIPTRQEGINRISDSMFFVDRIVKDMKLGEAAGITLNACGSVGTPCLLEVEHVHADHATFAIRANLRALREAFTGTTPTTDGPAFDDMLSMIGHADVADRMTASLDAAIAAADELPASFLDALANDYGKVKAAHIAISVFTDDLKSQFLALLALDVPDDVASDND